MPPALTVPDTPALRKARGAFFTPAAVADFLARWAVRSPDDRVLEPSCGEAQFLLAAGAQLQELGRICSRPDQLEGIELHEASAATARAAMADAGMAAKVRTGDFFDIAPDAAVYDAVIGNPPYVRYHGFTGETRATAQRRALSVGVRLSGLASSWAGFTVCSASMLRPGGRLGLVLPAELLTVNYAAPVRRFLLERFGTVRVVMFDERVFPGVLADVVLLLAEGTGGTRQVEVTQARNFDELDDSRSITWTPPHPEAKWSTALLPPPAVAVYDGFRDDASFCELEDWGSTDLGMVSGNNRYFCLSAPAAVQAGLDERDLLRISPPGSRHLRGLTFSHRAWCELRDEGRQVFLFAPRDALSPPAVRYIEGGDAAGVHTAYKCRVRQPWWHVPRVPAPDLFLTYMNADTPRITTNEAAVLHLNSVHGVRLRDDVRGLGRDLLPLASLNSVTVLGAELVGRSYGGGILKLEPREADLLPVPSPGFLRDAAGRLAALRPHLAQQLRAGNLLGAVELVDRVLLTEGAGLRRNQVRELRDARALLYKRRTARGAS